MCYSFYVIARLRLKVGPQDIDVASAATFGVLDNVHTIADTLAASDTGSATGTYLRTISVTGTSETYVRGTAR